VYYWEIVVLLRKFITVAVSQFLVIYSAEVQVLIMILILCFFILQVRITPPYKDKVLGDLEKFSLSENLFYIYAGLFFVIASHHDFLDDNIIIRVILFLIMIIPMLGY
jgi:hypothetical protein